ncbi:general odorant-binding protein 67-like isoform X1 [Culex pipiens pallens]|uniref:general odorant-binding protein 67-like isoform X1 n=1 Tax=Culex pipiens pallens TaxID=42434 RepID=UPI001954FD43|nr:general odorant-binding protein 67-like isoform X1 [Culex pipiens pallens]
MAKFITALLTTVTMFMVVLAQPEPDNPTCSQGNKKTVNDCCKMPSIGEQAVLNRCMAENPKPKTPPTPGTKKTEGCCVAQCLLTSVNAFTNNAIDKNAVKQALKTTIGADPNFAPLVDGIVEQCHSSVSSNAALKATPVPATPGRAGCSFLPEAFVNCVGSTFVQKCPTAAWTNNNDCNQLKQKLASGCSLASL